MRQIDVECREPTIPLVRVFVSHTKRVRCGTVQVAPYGVVVVANREGGSYGKIHECEKERQEKGQAIDEREETGEARKASRSVIIPLRTSHTVIGQREVSRGGAVPR